MTDGFQFWALLVATFLLAGLVKGVIGLGLPTVAVGLLGLVIPPVQAVALLIVPSLVTNVWQLAVGGRLGPLLRRLWSMMLGICLGTWLGVRLLGGVAAEGATTALGIALVAYAAFGLARLSLHAPPRAERWLAPVMGGLTGVVSVATGVFVLPGVPYLQAMGLEKDELVQALGLSFTVSTVALGVGLAHGGALQGGIALASVVALGPALAGMALGQLLRRHIAPSTFRLCFFAGLLVLGGHLALRG